STVQTDGRRLQQVLKNLLSNAFKFTEQGRVKLRVQPAQRGWSVGHPILDTAPSVIAFAVEDTGIGIPRDKQQIIFEAFQQADGTTSRKYGGTGLGLSISREIALLLGGEITVSSEVGKGSTFTLFVPERYLQTGPQKWSLLASSSPPLPAIARAPLEVTEVLSRTLRDVPPALETLEQLDPALLAIDELDDDRGAIHPGDRVLLIIEDDAVFARLLMGLARENGFKALAALRGDVGLALALEHKPDAITLDIGLPVIDGWALLDRLKHDPRTRHIPVHIISATEEERHRGLRAGAIAVIRKPVSPEELKDALKAVKSFVERPLKYLLVIEDDPAQRQSIVALIGNGDVQTTAVGSGAEALQRLTEVEFDCVVMDLGLPDMSGAELLGRIKQQVQRDLPVIIYTGKELSEQEELALKRFTDSIIIKSAKSPEHLLDETALFLHRVESNLPEAKRKMLKQAQLTDPMLEGRKVLVVDDDVRNIFALTSVLERANMQVLFAENGKKGMELIRTTPDLSVVLMDVMMPEMDGYETMRAIRSEPELRSLPVIALTAKAMKGDRERCIEAGASDYITKPVDSDQLLSLLRVWVYQRGAAASARA
ncbi:MAG TPA: response regulator, partial [Myxococcaceae bacterium]|nr:response regulator [Myxococcaceae bacterium]